MLRLATRDSSLFGRVARLRATAERTPAEDRLTEVFAAVLERVPGLALDLGRRWLDPREESAAANERATSCTTEAWHALQRLPAETGPRVTTQVPAAGRRVDLELRFPAGPNGAQTLVVRVEVKHGTYPERGQIPAYQRSMPQNGQPHAVVLLGPRSDLPLADDVEAPSSVPRRSWQRTARDIAAFSVDNPVAAWLQDEMTKFLYWEGLMDPEALRPEHLTALAYYDEAESALAIICERAAERLVSTDSLGACSEEERKSGIGYGAWWDTPPGWDSERWNGAFFEWGIGRPNLQAQMPTIHLFAGLSVEKPARFDDGASRGDWQSRLEDGVPSEGPRGELISFRYWLGNAHRLRRLALPQDVLRGATLEAQGDSLARWVEQTFHLLGAYGPPR